MQRIPNFKTYQYVYLFGFLIGFVLYSNVLNFQLTSPIHCKEIDCTCTAAPTSKEIILQEHVETTTSSRNVNLTLSLCSDRATLVGPGQKVISFSLFIKDKSTNESVDRGLGRYASNLWGNLNRTRELYPGWLMRLYTDIYDQFGVFESLMEEKDFFLCNTTNIPVLGSITAVEPMVWRFVPIGDPTVSIFVSRDTDSLIGTRERSAVKQWEDSNKIFHGMRDHPNHKFLVLGGMWGAKTSLISKPMRQAILNIFIEVPKLKVFSNDQSMLYASIYALYKPDFMIHDSYHCETYKDSIPFPEQRTDLENFVGSFYGSWRSSYYMIPVEICPIPCRPKYGLNWTYC